jgi:hypothetical protein
LEKNNPRILSAQSITGMQTIPTLNNHYFPAQH